MNSGTVGVKLAMAARSGERLYRDQTDPIIELKAIEEILPVHEAQLLTYLRHTGKRVGLLINFNVAILKNGIRRRVL
jgi:PD-(D/E)XK nuclease superfamily